MIPAVGSKWVLNPPSKSGCKCSFCAEYQGRSLIYIKLMYKSVCVFLKEDGKEHSIGIPDIKKYLSPVDEDEVIL